MKPGETLKDPKKCVKILDLLILDILLEETEAQALQDNLSDEDTARELKETRDDYGKRITEKTGPKLASVLERLGNDSLIGMARPQDTEIPMAAFLVAEINLQDTTVNEVEC